MKNGFLKGLLIYVITMVVLIFVGLGVFWQYIAAYERSRPEGVMARYVAQDLPVTVARSIGNFAENERSELETPEARTAALEERLSGEFSYRKTPGEFTQETPVYTVRVGETELGTVRLVARGGGLMSFGFSRWAVGESALNLAQFGTEYTVSAPEGAAMAVNGVTLSEENCDVRRGVPEELSPYVSELAELPTWANYSFTAFSVPDVKLLSDSGEYWLSWDESDPGVFTVTQQCSVELSEQLHGYAQDFVRAYVAYTSHAVEGPGQVQSYMVPGGSLYERMTASMDGMSWVHGVTATMSELVADKLHYYGCAATLEARYVLRDSSGGQTDKIMKIILTQTDNGWKVANIELQ